MSDYDSDAASEAGSYQGSDAGSAQGSDRGSPPGSPAGSDSEVEVRNHYHKMSSQSRVIFPQFYGFDLSQFREEEGRLVEAVLAPEVAAEAVAVAEPEV